MCAYVLVTGGKGATPWSEQQMNKLKKDTNGKLASTGKGPLKCGGVCAHIVMYIASRFHVSPRSAEALVR